MLPAYKDAGTRAVRDIGGEPTEERGPISRELTTLSSGSPPLLCALEEDRALLEGFRKGDPAALAHVFRRYVHEVMRSLRAGVTIRGEGGPVRMASHLSEHDLENLMQETFARAFTPQARAAYDGLRPYGAYLATIARNLLVDRARKRIREAKRFVMVDDVDIGGGPSDPGQDPIKVLEEKELSAILSRFCDGLNDEDRRVFHVRYEQQTPLRAAAKELGMGVFELRRRDARLRLRLLEALRSAGFLQQTRIKIGDSVLRRERKGEEEVGT